jgi:hypothetical protein
MGIGKNEMEIKLRFHTYAGRVLFKRIKGIPHEQD